MAITAQDVNKLRKMTGAGMMDCKNALTEAEGDFDQAVEILRKKGQKISAKRADRETTEGAVFAQTSNNGSVGYLVSLTCETDFVAKNDDFVALGEKLLAATVKNEVGTEADLKVVALEDGRSVEEHITDLMGKIGEKILVEVVKAESEQVVPYIHSNKKLGVLVSLQGAGGKNVEEVGKDVAMQIAAMNPVGVSEDDVTDEVKERELNFGKEKALAEGKPEAIVEKIAQGMLTKFMKDNTLLAQPFVKDNSKSVAQVLKEVNGDLTVSAFKRIAIG